jgi:adenosylcobinamide hydrolase
MVAGPIKHLKNSRVSSGGGWVESFVTVGVTNTVRAGERLRGHSRGESEYAVEKIILLLVTNVSFSNASMVGAVQVATETETGALRDHDVPSWTENRGATGLGTSSRVIVGGMIGQGA